MPAASPREQPQPSARHTSSLWMALTAPTRPHCPKKGLALENLKFPFSRTDALPLTTDQFEQKPLAKQPDAGQDNFGEEWVLLLPCWPQGTRRPCRGPLVLHEARMSLPAQGVSMPGGFCAPFRVLSSQQTPRTQFLIHHSKNWLLAQGKKRTRITRAREDDDDEQPHCSLCACRVTAATLQTPCPRTGSRPQATGTALQPAGELEAQTFAPPRCQSLLLPPRSGVLALQLLGDSPHRHSVLAEGSSPPLGSGSSPRAGKGAWPKH